MPLRQEESGEAWTAAHEREGPPPPQLEHKVKPTPSNEGLKRRKPRGAKNLRIRERRISKRRPTRTQAA
eukprot:797519-Prorocentrum_lima.AAC.1